MIIACFDGHGDYGHDVSRFCKSFIETELVSHPLFSSNLNSAILDVTSALGKTSGHTYTDRHTHTDRQTDR